jgi:hypothetical protein
VLSRAAEASPSADDTLVLPALFLYRHYLELQLKWLIRRAASLLRITDDFKPHHDLARQWEDCKLLLAQAIPQEYSASEHEVSHVGRIIKEMAKIDPDSYAFRYPENKRRSPALPSSFSHVTMRNVREVMEKVDIRLSGDAECLEARAEFLSEYESFDPGIYDHGTWQGP